MHLPSSRTPLGRLAALAAFGLCLALPPAARADGDAAGGVGVARVSLIQGPVAVRRGDSASPVDAVINAPVLGGDYVTTGDGARAEVQFDGSSAVRLDSGVQLRITRLEGTQRSLQLAEGTVELRLLRGPQGRAALDTPSLSVRPHEAGAYRVSVDGDGRTLVTVRSGAADIVTPHGTQVLLPGTTVSASGSVADPVLSSSSAVAADDFDRFNGERDQRAQRALAQAAYVDTNIEGVDDLTQYGRWVADGSYGTVWVPYNVASNWAPYRQGRWVWEDYYGWTWVADEPWGWAPYHYGSWYRSAAYGWCWYPARPHVVAIWRPALVAFFTFGGGGWGADIGWVPLAPFEPYRPWWGSSYTNVTNITNVTNVTNNYYGGGSIAGSGSGELTRMYQNARHDGVTAIGSKRFLEGRFEHPVAVAPGQLRRVAIVRGAVPVVPSEANLRFRSAGGAAPAMRSVLVERTFAGDAKPVLRTPFEQQRSAVVALTHPAAPRAAGEVTRTVTAGRESSDPWSRFGGAHAVRPVQVIDGTVAAPTGHAATTSRAATGGVPRRTMTDPWSRFGATGGTTATETTRGARATDTTTTHAAASSDTTTRPARGGGGTSTPRSSDSGAPRRATGESRTSGAGSSRPVEHGAPAAAPAPRSAPAATAPRGAPAAGERHTTSSSHAEAHP